MTYEQTLEFLYNQRSSTYKGLQRIEYLLAQLGNPQHTFPSVLITGTNGKGSVAKMISSVLKQAGYRTGGFTSPHLVDFRERILINDAMISRDDVVELTQTLLDGAVAQLERDRATLGIEGSVVFFEMVTAMAFLYFARQKIDIAVLEVGIGGRLDATNTVNPLVSILTTIGLDHQDLLGETIELITREKAAIIRERGDVVIGCQPPEALAVIQETCREKQAALYATGIQGNCVYPLAACTIPHQIESTGSRFAYRGIHANFDEIALSLIGTHQFSNAAAALCALELLAQKGFQISESAIRKGLAQATHPGRMEILHTQPTIVADIAHNGMGAITIAKALTSLFTYEKLVLVIGVLHDKDVRAILAPFLEIADSLVFTSPHSTYRAEAASQTAAIAEEVVTSFRQDRSRYRYWLVVESVQDAIRQARTIAGDRDLICITGSNYTVSEAEIFLKK